MAQRVGAILTKAARQTGPKVEPTGWGPSGTAQLKKKKNIKNGATAMHRLCFLGGGVLMINAEAFSSCVTLRGGLAHGSRWARYWNRVWMRLVMCSECCPCSAPGGEWESGRKFAQTVSKFWRVCMLMEFPADYTEVSDRVDPFKEQPPPHKKNIYIYQPCVASSHLQQYESKTG